jgi:hypothetical protein
MAHPLCADVCCVLECDTVTDLAAVHLDRQNTVVNEQSTKMTEHDIYLHEEIAWVAAWSQGTHLGTSNRAIEVKGI